jgi:hypothetical protein
MALRSPDPQSPHHKSLCPFSSDYLPPLILVSLCKLPTFHHVALACRIHQSETNSFFCEKLSDVNVPIPLWVETEGLEKVARFLSVPLGSHFGKLQSLWYDKVGILYISQVRSFRTY